MMELTLTREHSGGRFRVGSGDAIIIRLAENPTTGYRWALDSIEGSGVTLEGMTFDRAEPNIGAGGTRTITYKASQAGTARIQLKRRREWERDGSEIERFEVTIEVQPQL